jgi:hypothetical protein
MTVFSSGQIELRGMTAEAENEVHVAEHAVQFEVAWVATAILFLIHPPQPTLAEQAFERLGWRAELDRDPAQDLGSVSIIWSTTERPVYRFGVLREVHSGLVAGSTGCAEDWAGTTRFGPVYEMPYRWPASCYHNGHAGCRLAEGCRTKGGVRRTSHRGMLQVRLSARSAKIDLEEPTGRSAFARLNSGSWRGTKREDGQSFSSRVAVLTEHRGGGVGSNTAQSRNVGRERMAK